MLDTGVHSWSAAVGRDVKTKQIQINELCVFVLGLRRIIKGP